MAGHHEIKKLSSALLLFAGLLACCVPQGAFGGVADDNQVPVSQPINPDIEQMMEIMKLLQQIYMLLGQRKIQEAIPLLVQVLPKLERTYGPDHNTTINTLDTLATLYDSQKAYTEAEPLYVRILASTEKSLGANHVKTAISATNLATLYMNQGNYAKAEQLYLRSLAIREQGAKPAKHEVAITLTNLGMLYMRLGESTKAETVLLRALGIREKTLGPNHNDTAESLSNVAAIYMAQGLYIKAEPLFLRALTIKEKSLGPNHLDTAVSLNNLGTLYLGTARYTQAEPLLVRAIRIKEKALGPQHSEVATSLNNLALLFKIQGAYAKAEPLYIRALSINEKALGPDHSSTATSLNNLGTLYDSQGYYLKAEPFLIRALKIRERTLVSDHPDISTSLSNLAVLYKNKGDYAKAEDFYLRAIEITENTLGPNHASTATIVNNAALLYKIKGDYAKAEHLYLRALAITETALGTNHPDTAKSLNNLAQLYSGQGTLSKAEPLQLRALEILTKALGPYHHEVATGLNNLALLYKIHGDYTKAEPLYQRALAINKKALGSDHADTAISLNNLAALYEKQGFFSKAESLLLRALVITEKALGPDHSDTAISLNNLAALYDNKRAYDKAEPLFLRALAITEKSLGPNHPSNAVSLNNLALLLSRQGAYDKAEPLLRRSLGIQSLFLQSQLPLLPQAGRLAQVKILDDSWEFVFSGAERSSSAAELALFSRLNRYGLLLDIEQRQALLSRSSETSRNLADQIASLTNNLADIKTTEAQREALGKRREELEKELYRLLPSLKPQLVEPTQVARLLPAGAVLVEFQRYMPFDGRQKEEQRWGAPRYLALVLNPAGSTRAVDLGPAAAIDPLIARALKEAEAGSGDPTTLWRQVNEKVFPTHLLQLLAGANQWILAPDGELSRIPYATLPSPGDPRRRLPDTVTLQLISTGRSLLPQNSSTDSALTKPLVLADPDFGPPPANGSGWRRLPASAKEGQGVSKLLRAALYEKADATTSVLTKAENPSLVHIASHGYYASASASPRPTPAPPPVAGLRSSIAGLPPSREDAMLNSGIVLAGANLSLRPDRSPPSSPAASESNADDGYLTAKEAAQLRLRGTELVVLSACDTASGEQQSGEGLFGLQRALSVAGARSTLLSLWKVDDDATAHFMERYYTLIKQGKGRMEALLAVQDEFRMRPLLPAWEDYRYWAAFQLVGDTGPIKGL